MLKKTLKKLSLAKNPRDWNGGCGKIFANNLFLWRANNLHVAKNLVGAVAHSLKGQCQENFVLTETVGV